jgi:hypothetical protein
MKSKGLCVFTDAVDAEAGSEMDSGKSCGSIAVLSHVVVAVVDDGAACVDIHPETSASDTTTPGSGLLTLALTLLPLSART